MPQSLDQLLNLPKEALPEAVRSLSPEDISELVPLLALKEDNIRYQAFLLLKERSAIAGDVFPIGRRFWRSFIATTPTSAASG